MLFIHFFLSCMSTLVINASQVMNISRYNMHSVYVCAPMHTRVRVCIYVFVRVFTYLCISANTCVYGVNLCVGL